MRKKLLLCAMLCSFAMHSFATIFTINVADFSFSPSTLTVHPGDSIMWVWGSGTHTTTSTTIPTGASSWDSPINSTATSFTYVASSILGMYNYKCTFHESMGMTGSFTVASATGISAVNSGTDVLVFPNPVSAKLYVQFAKKGSPARITITDLLGKQVMQENCEAGNATEIDIKEIPSGLYMLKVLQAGQLFQQKLVVMH